MNIIQATLKYKQVTLSILAIAFLTGVYLLATMPRREDAKVSIRQALIYAFYPGADAETVEKQVTQKLEQYLFQFEEVNKKKTVSSTYDGVAVVTVDLQESVENEQIFWNTLKHELNVAKVLDFPEGVIGPVVNSNFGDVEAMVVGVSSPTADYARLQTYAQKIEDRLRTIDGLSKIKRLGEQTEQYSVRVRTDRMAQYGLSVAQIAAVLRSENKQVPGGSVEQEGQNTVFHVLGQYDGVDALKRQIVGASLSGAMIRLGDVADVVREDSEPTGSASVDGMHTVLLAIEAMDEKNITVFGYDMDRMIDEIRQTLPSDIRLTTIVDQPEVVHEQVSHFLWEFLGALVSVILVIMLLLPFRIAVVASMAIPMTISLTILLMHTFGVELHQVSFAALILVLGMVVDDAIVIADNYVALLDSGISRKEAAWRCATEMVVPILTATSTIIATFLPLALMLTGRIGEFIYALPLTVSLALASSFVVAMLLTPILCYAFIKKGIKEEESAGKKKHFSVLDSLSGSYNRLIEYCFRHKRGVITLSILSVVATVGLLLLVPQQFFPAADRNQFVIDIQMPAGTDYPKTEEASGRVARLLDKEKGVVNYTEFVGMSAPRFYYNFTPRFPRTDFGQFLVNTADDKATIDLVGRLEDVVADAVPEARTHVRRMEQGMVADAPVEVRISGEDIACLKSIYAQVDSIVRAVPGAGTVWPSFGEGLFSLGIRLKDNAAQLGFTREMVAMNVYSGFSGVPVTVVHEGDRSLNVVIRLPESDRNDASRLGDMYVQSPVTGKSVPLRQIAEIVPEWKVAEIDHRNGVRSLTLECRPAEGVLAADVLAQVRPQIDNMSLPVGYSIEYGGEQANKMEVVGEMAGALGVGILLIFMILLIEFKRLREVLLVMSAIPFCLFGAFLGLWLSGYPLGFTAFIGLMSLAGIVVRNSIILIEHADELIVAGESVEQAALDAGKRRLRPIFLTSTATAIGVVPMIVSGSQLWGPLAVCLSCGIIWSMFMALVAIPVIYSKIRRDKPIPVGAKAVVMVLALLVGGTGAATAQDDRPVVTIEQLQQAAGDNSRALRIKRQYAAEKKEEVGEMKIKNYPVVSLASSYVYSRNLAKMTIEKGYFGTLPLLPQLSLPLPADRLSMNLTDHNALSAGAMLYQPLTQLGKVSAGVGVSRSDARIAAVEEEKAASQISHAVEQLYYELLAADAEVEAKQAALAYSEAQLADVGNAAEAGKAMTVQSDGMQAKSLSDEQDLLKARINADNLADQLQQLTGIDVRRYRLDTTALYGDETIAFADMASDENFDVRIAALTVDKATYGVKASKWSNLPDIGVFAGYTWMNNSTVFPENNFLAGVAFSWNLQDLWSNSKVRRRRELQLSQARENQLRLTEQNRDDINKALRKIKQYEQLKDVARRSLRFREEQYRILVDSRASGLVPETKLLEGVALLQQARADYVAANAGYRVALSEYHILLGR